MHTFILHFLPSILVSFKIGALEIGSESLSLIRAKVLPILESRECSKAWKNDAINIYLLTSGCTHKANSVTHQCSLFL